MASYLIIYDSTRDGSRGACLNALIKYPTATLYDSAGVSLTDLTTYIGTLVADTYTKILVCVGARRVEPVGGSCVVTVSNKGADTDSVVVTVADGVDTLTLGHAVGNAAGDTTSVAQVLKTSINAGTAHHGYVASGDANAITITAPTTFGALANAYTAAVVVKQSGGLAASVTTAFAVAATGVTAVGVSGDISQAQFVSLEAKILAAAETTGTAAAGAATTITLANAAGTSAVNDYYNGMSILLNGGTGANQFRVITDYVGTTRVATISGHTNWGTNPDGTSTYIVSNDLLYYGETFGNGKTPYRLMWEHLMSEYDVPFPVSLIGGNLGTYLYAKWGSGDVTSGASAAGTLVDAGEFVNHAYNEGTLDAGDYYVGIAVSSANGREGQIRKITHNTTGQLDIEPNWDFIPESGDQYQICLGDKYVLWDQYLSYGLASRYYFTGTTTPAKMLAECKRLVDKYDGIANGSPTIYGDEDLLEEIIAEGKVIFEARSRGVVS